MFQYCGRGIAHVSSEAPEIVERERFETKTNKILVVDFIIVKIQMGMDILIK